MVKTNRPRGILSKADRELLTGESEIEPKSQQERNARARIRERIEAGLGDFELLADATYLEDRDLDRVLQSDSSTTDGNNAVPVADLDLPTHLQPQEVDIAPEIMEGLVEMVAFAYRVKPSPTFLERILKTGIRRGLDRRDTQAQLSDVQISMENRETLDERLEAYIDFGWRLNQWEIIYAIENELRPAEEIATHVRKHGTRGDDWRPGNPRHRLPLPEACPECGGNLNEEHTCIECGTEVEIGQQESNTDENSQDDEDGTDSESN